MSTITPNTVYPDGSVISVTDHNANIYSTTNGRGVMSEPNGRLQSFNRSAGFVLLGEHVMPEEATMARMDGVTMPMDIFNDAFGQRNDDDPSYVPIGGLCKRMHFPYDVSCVIWQWSFFVMPHRAWIYDAEQQAGYIPEMRIRAFFDGTEVAAMRRQMPVGAAAKINTFVDEGYEGEQSDGVVDNYDNYEQQSTLWFDLSRMQKNVTAGLHDLSIRLFIPRTYAIGYEDGNEEQPINVPINRYIQGYSPGGFFNYIFDVDPERVRSKVRQRISFGTRNVRLVAFK